MYCSYISYITINLCDSRKIGIVKIINPYDEVQLATPIVSERMKTILKTEPVDYDALKAETQKLSKLNDQRDESLEILAKYSEQASDKLNVIFARRVEAERIIEDLDEGIDIDLDERVKALEEIRGK